MWPTRIITIIIDYVYLLLRNRIIIIGYNKNAKNYTFQYIVTRLFLNSNLVKLKPEYMIKTHKILYYQYYLNKIIFLKLKLIIINKQTLFIDVLISIKCFPNDGYLFFMNIKNKICHVHIYYYILIKQII